jgi:hypothetical protein
MRKLRNSKKELVLIILHISIGVCVYNFRITSLFFNILMIAILSFFILKAKNKTIAVFIACAYVASSDVFFRMTKGLVFYELHKYLLLFFALLGIFFQLNKTKGKIYLLYIFVLLFTIFYTEYDFYDNIRKMIAFNLSGPISLGVFALFCYKKKISLTSLYSVLFYLLLPIISLVTYLFLYTPSIKDVVTGTGSNFATSGGFGPNQVATILGLGMFILISRLLLLKNKGVQLCVELLLLLLITFRCIVTFSRGGLLTALIAALFFIVLTFSKSNYKLRKKIYTVFTFFIIIGVGVWFYAVSSTSGLIENRYSNENALGQEKADISTGRSTLIIVELEAFMEHPFLGIGVGKNKQYRFEKTGIIAASHNEISRLLAEHGTFGIIALIILIFTPLFLRLENKTNIFFYSFFLFWFLTINHTSMRIAFPSFIYGLSLLDVTYNAKKKTTKIVS